MSFFDRLKSLEIPRVGAIKCGEKKKKKRQNDFDGAVRARAATTLLRGYEPPNSHGPAVNSQFMALT